ncbi:hypothetical protein [Caudoviricetes sp.]|nr:hypothetical protein [Caudoviricetes sp.]
MSKSNTFENDILKLIFNNVDIADIGDAGGLQNSAAAGNLYIALHTSDPGEAGNASTNESAYTSYARVAVARDAGGWTVSGNSATNAALIQFPECTGGSETITHVSITTASSGTSKILYSGALSASRSVSSGIQPQFAANALTVTED